MTWAWIQCSDSTVMQDHPVLYETTTYAVEQKAVHSSSSYYSTSASSSYYSTSAYPLPARRDSPEYLRISNQVVSHVRTQRVSMLECLEYMSSVFKS